MTAAALPVTAGLRRAATRRALLLPAILVLAALLRAVAARTPSIHHPDEAYQYLEAAHRLVFGYGVVPWEYKVGIRNWLVPLLLAGPMLASRTLAPDGTLYLVLIRALMILLSLAAPWSGWRLGRAISPRHGAMAALVGAAWAEFVFFAPHALAENVAGALLLGAAVALRGGRGPVGAHALVAGGALLGLAGIARFQFAPALAVLAIVTCRRDARAWALLLAGGLAAAAVGAAIDLWSGDLPFAWLARNVRENLIGGRAAQYGTLGPLGYVAWLKFMWGWWFVVIAPLAWLGRRRYPALFWAAMANLVAHSLIAHKEYRFVEISAALLVLLAAIGSVDAGERLLRRFPLRRPDVLWGAIAATWLAAAAAQAAAVAPYFNRSAGMLAAVRLVRQDEGACGVALVGVHLGTGGYSQLHRPFPISAFGNEDALLSTPDAARRALARWDAGYNRMVLVSVDRMLTPRGFERTGCAGDICVYARPGGCRPTPESPFLLQRVFDRDDERVRAAIRKGLRPTG